MQNDNGLHVQNLRRRLLAAGASLPVLAWTDTLHAQAPEKIRRIGLLADTPPTARITPFRQALRNLGWVEGKNIIIEARHAERSKAEAFPELVADLLRLKVDVIFARASAAARAAQQATTTTPIVTTYFGDPVAAGLVETIGRPDGNVTGLFNNPVESAGKQLELLKEILPKLTRAAVLWSAPIDAKRYWERIQPSAKQLGIQLHPIEVVNNTEFEKAFENAARARVGALLVVATPLIQSNLKQIASLAVKYRLPSIHNWSAFTDAGGLLTYGASHTDFDKRAATFVDKILKGARAGDLPMEPPIEFNLIINLKAARSLGITMPLPILARADRVIGE
jgi:putative tryptophan/tyrosine transport system substrate-binding protein